MTYYNLRTELKTSKTFLKGPRTKIEKSKKRGWMCTFAGRKRKAGRKKNHQRQIVHQPPPRVAP